MNNEECTYVVQSDEVELLGPSVWVGLGGCISGELAMRL